MADQESDSSSCDTSSDCDTDSSLDNTNQPSSSKPFVLECLQQEDKASQQKIFNAYLHNKNYFLRERKLYLTNKTTEPVPTNFTSWWESFKTTKKSNCKGSSKDSQNENSFYDNWFDKSIASDDSKKWLCEPKQKSSSEVVPQVDDIEVPSIYGNVSKSQPKGRRALKKERREQRNKTTGKKWFNMKLPDVDSKTKMDMEILQMRRALDPKRHYKQNDRKGLPKYFQLGTVVDEGTDFFSSRLTKKQRKQTLVEELMADVNVRQYNKKKYEELQQKERSKKKFPKKRKT